MKVHLFVIVALLSHFSRAQSGYKIDIKIKGLKDTTAYLFYYYGEATVPKDTARVNSQGLCTFDGKTALPQGVYMYVLGKSKHFEFMVSNQQHFQMETVFNDYIPNMKVTGDEDNKIYFDNLNFIGDQHKDADPLLKIIRDTTLKEDQKKEAREAFQKINTKVVTRQEEIINKYPTTLTARILKLNRPIQVPDPPKKPDGSIDSSFQLRYYRKHFFDNFDLADPALIQLSKPYYSDKLNEYLDKLFLQSPDTLVAAIDGVASVAKKNQEAYKYLVWACCSKYRQPKIMGLDEVYVRLVDKYFISGEMDYWINAKFKQTLKEEADKLRTSLVGKTGGNLSMQDQNFQQKSLYDIKKKYTVIYFFDPDCGHCREQSPKLVSFYEQNKVKYNLEVYAVSLDTSMQKMRNYIKEMKMTWITVNAPRSYNGPFSKMYNAETTPTIYILDDTHKIVAKGLPVEKVDDFLSHYEKFLQRKTNQKPKGS
jgi:thiol-disulfide isomerase/thioredoxin